MSKVNVSEPNQQTDQEVLWRKFDVHRASLGAVAKAQGRFVAGLLTFLAVLWGWNYARPTEFRVEFLGATVQANALWTIAPAVLTVLVLSLIGAMNAAGPVWKRLLDCADKLHVVFFSSDLDPHKNLIDFFVLLKIWPEGPAEPYHIPDEHERLAMSCTWRR